MGVPPVTGWGLDVLRVRRSWVWDGEYSSHKGPSTQLMSIEYLVQSQSLETHSLCWFFNHRDV